MLDIFRCELARELSANFNVLQFSSYGGSTRLRLRPLVTENGLKHRQKFVAAQVAARPLVRYPGPEVRDFTKNGGEYISVEDAPSGATGCWLPDSDLEPDTDSARAIAATTTPTAISFVGIQNETAKIDRGQLVRVSLARWWKPDDRPGL